MDHTSFYKLYNKLETFFVVLECIQGSSSKFYIYKAVPNSYKVFQHYGKIGTAGLTSERNFSSHSAAIARIWEHISAKLKKGYKLSKKTPLELTKDNVSMSYSAHFGPKEPKKKETKPVLDILF